MATGRIGTTPVLQVRWSKAPTAGTTSLSGLDDNSVSLVYSIGYEAVYRNGVLLSRGNDYTATNGTTVTLIDATITGDIIEIFANQTVPLSDTFSQTVADGRFIKNTLTTTTGDIIYASGANTPARLGIGSSAQVLTVSGGIPAWTTPAGGMTLINTGGTTLTGASVLISSIPATYNDLFIVFRNFKPTNDTYGLDVRANDDSNANRHRAANDFSSVSATAFNDTKWAIGEGTDNTTSQGLTVLHLFDYANTTTWKLGIYYNITTDPTTNTSFRYRNGRVMYNQTGAISSLRIQTESGGGDLNGGTVLVYGVK